MLPFKLDGKRSTTQSKYNHLTSSQPGTQIPEDREGGKGTVGCTVLCHSFLRFKKSMGPVTKEDRPCGFNVKLRILNLYIYYALRDPVNSYCMTVV